MKNFRNPAMTLRSDEPATGCRMPVTNGSDIGALTTSISYEFNVNDRTKLGSDKSPEFVSAVRVSYMVVDFFIIMFIVSEVHCVIGLTNSLAKAKMQHCSDSKESNLLNCGTTKLDESETNIREALTMAIILIYLIGGFPVKIQPIDRVIDYLLMVLLQLAVCL